jgi:hypothetical protein
VDGGSTPDLAESRTHLLGRVAALFGGVVILIGITIVSVGVALCAPIGVWIGARFHRSRGRRFDAWGSWLSAVGAVIIALTLVACVVATQVPRGALERARQAADSAAAQAPRRPPPAWLDRIVPGGAARYSASTPAAAPAFTGVMMVFGLMILIGVLGSIIGSIGWVASTLLTFSFSGRWLGQSPAVAIEADAAG